MLEKQEINKLCPFIGGGGGECLKAECALWVADVMPVKPTFFKEKNIDLVVGGCGLYVIALYNIMQFEMMARK